MAKYSVNRTGLRPRDTYEQIVDYLHFGQDKIKMPNRYHTQLRNSPYMSQINAEGEVEMEKQQMNQMKEQQKENDIRQLASLRGLTASSIRARPEAYSIASSRSDSSRAWFSHIAGSEQVMCSCTGELPHRNSS